ncbi:MAG: hydrogenase maturation protease [Verrucomicrobiia bacterium]
MNWEKTLVLGLGNDILCDDAIGLMVTQHLSEIFKGSEVLDFKQTCEMGLSLLDHIVGYGSLVIIDAIKSGNYSVGTVIEIDPDEIKPAGLNTPHFLGIKETLELGKKMGLKMPEKILILGIEVENPFTISERLSEVMESHFEEIVRKIKERLFVFIKSADQKNC